MKSQVSAKSRPLQDLKRFNIESSDAFSAMIDRYAHDLSRYHYLPLQAKTMDLVVVIDRLIAEVLEIVVLAPWR